jgi:hypothetical protein
MSYINTSEISMRGILKSALSFYSNNFKPLILISFAGFIMSALILLSDFFIKSKWSSFLIKSQNDFEMATVIVNITNLILSAIGLWVFIALIIFIYKKSTCETITLKNALSNPRKVFLRTLGVEFGYVFLVFLPIISGLFVISQLIMNFQMKEIFGSIFRGLLHANSNTPIGTTNSALFLNVLVIIIALVTAAITIYIAVKYLFAIIFAINESKEKNSFQFSAGIVKKRFWNVIRIIMIPALVTNLLTIAILIIEAIIGKPLEPNFALLFAITDRLFTMIVNPLFFTFLVIFYIKLKETMQTVELVEENKEIIKV